MERKIDTKSFVDINKIAPVVINNKIKRYSIFLK